MKDTLRLVIGLGVTCLLAATVLAVANLATEAPIRKAKALERQKNLAKVLPAFTNKPADESEIVRIPVKDRQGKNAGEATFYRARDAAKGNQVVAVAGEATTGKGFGGNVTVMAGISPDGALIHVVVTNHSETPGLGTNATDRMRTRYIWQAFSRARETGLPPSTYLDQYADRNSSTIAAASFHVVGKSAALADDTVLAVSGATISSRAVADAVNLICTAFEASKDEILSQ